MTDSISVSAEGAPPSAGSPADALTHPVAPADFLARYWQRRAVHLTGWPDRLAGTFSREALRGVLERQQETGIGVRVSSDHEGDGGAAAAHIAVDATDVADYLRDGTSVCIDGVERADAHVAALASAFREGLGYVGPVTVKCYFSTPGYGFNLHFDAQIVVTLQIEGTKRWRVSRSPGVPFPLENAFLDDAQQIRYMGRTPSSLADWERRTPDPDDLVEVTLQPGDVLCLPAGTWHEAKAGDSASLALNFSFSPLDVLAVLTDVVRDELESDEAWRSGLPPGRESAPALAARARELAAALNRLADDAPGLERALEGDRAVAPARRSGAKSAAASHAEAMEAGAALGGSRLQCVLGVADAVRAADWYRDVLGSRVVSSIPEFGWIEVSTPIEGVTLGLTELPPAIGNRGAVLDFEVEDLEAIRAVLLRSGAAVDDGVTDIAGIARTLSAADPDGNSLMFFEAYPTAGRDD